MSFGDLKLRGHFDIFCLVYTEVIPGRLTTNHKFYRPLGRLHGPWCKQPLRSNFHEHINGTCFSKV